jgi:hypothetical protein
LRRQPQFGGSLPAGSSRPWRLDPLALPVRFSTDDAGADHHVRWVELDRERVVLRRAVRGIAMTIKVPLCAFLGVALHLDAHERPGFVAVSLEHRDPALSVPLFQQFEATDAVAEWQLWARVLRLPLLVSDRSGTLREAFDRIGGVRLRPVCPRRRRRNAIKTRRPAVLLRRRVPWRLAALRVHRGEREIIARN